jgi:hypothetical protein
VVQILAFAFMCLLLTQFTLEFTHKGFPRTIPLVGDQWSQLAGVVLFNYAYIVTVPSWLSEKKNHVSVNTTIWTSSTLSSAIYFGTYEAMVGCGVVWWYAIHSVPIGCIA